MDSMNYILISALIGVSVCLLLACIIILKIDSQWLKHSKTAVKKRREQAIEEPCCGNCKHTDKTYKERPCDNCIGLSEWEEKE